MRSRRRKRPERGPPGRWRALAPVLTPPRRPGRAPAAAAAGPKPPPARVPLGRAPRSPVERLFRRMLRRLVAELRRHVTLVMLGEDIVGDEGRALHPAFGDDTAAFAEQVRRDAAVAHRHPRLAV